MALKDKIISGALKATPVGAGLAAAGAIAAGTKKTEKKTAETDPIIFIFAAVAIYLIDVLTRFNGLELNIYNLADFNFIRAIIFNGFVAFALILYMFLAKIHLRDKADLDKFFSFAILIFVFSLIMSLGGIGAEIRHFLLVLILFFLYYKSSEDKTSINYTFAILLLIDFFGYVAIPKVIGSYFPAAVSAGALNTVANRLIFPVWLFYVLLTKGQESKFGRIFLIGIIIVLAFYFLSGYFFLQALDKAAITPAQYEAAKNVFVESWDNMKRFVYEFSDSIKCASLIGGSSTEYEDCLTSRRIERECQDSKNREAGETVAQCIERMKKAKKTSGAIDTSIKDYVSAEIGIASPKDKFTNQESVEIIYQVEVKSSNIPIKIDNVKCEFTNQKTKEKINGKYRTTLPINQETVISGVRFITCMPETKLSSGTYESAITAEVKDVETYATLTLYFYGNVNQLLKTPEEGGISLYRGTYQEQLANERNLWPAIVNEVLVGSPKIVQSIALPGLISFKIGEPLINGQITTLPIKPLQEGESMEMSIGLVNKATGKVTNIKELILDLPKYTARTPEGDCEKFQPALTEEYNRFLLNDKTWLENKAKTLANQQKETEVSLMACNIQIANYDKFLAKGENTQQGQRNKPSGPHYFTVRSTYDYEMKKNHIFTITAEGAT